VTSRIQNLVVLMLENRSFDHVLGFLKREKPELDGLTGNETNPSSPAGSPLQKPPFCVTDSADPLRDIADPPHELLDVGEQLYGVQSNRYDYTKTPKNNGFYRCYSRAAAGKGAEVLAAFAPGRLPAIHTLAREFAVCDRWFSSVPGPTWPNRFFAHCASAGGYLDGKPTRNYPMPSVFSRLEQKRIASRIYFHDVPQAAALTELRSELLTRRFRPFSSFLEDAQNGELPAYSFIEPNYGTFGLLDGAGEPNDQHPPHGMATGDALVAAVYGALRASPQWSCSALLVVWDEHGGFYDHVPPPPALPPGDGYVGQYGFGFNRLGVRVPAIVVSPWVARGFVDHQTYDHASIPATLGELFGIAPLTQRDQRGASFARLFKLPSARTDAPLRLPTVKAAPKSTRVARRAAAAAEPNHLQRSLLELSHLLPHAATEAVPTQPTAADQRATASQRVAAFLAAAGHTPRRIRSTRVRPDRIDLRDRRFAPRIDLAPPPECAPKAFPAPVLDQGSTAACTGYALASYLQHLLARAGRAADGPVSPRMLYSMARRYDEFPGWQADEGSTLRGAMRGWFRHGACTLTHWPDSVPLNELPAASVDPEQDWWSDAVTRPLGAYYRVDAQSIADMHAAIVEIGAIYVSAQCHGGWDEGNGLSPAGGTEPAHAPPMPALPDVWTIPLRAGSAAAGGHAFVIVGYDAEGFIILNSWGETWGTQGLARLTYADWSKNAMDAWVAQLGVVTSLRRAVARSTTLRVEHGTRRVQLATDPVLRDHELDAFIIDVGNNGRLSQTGRFRTQPADISLLLSHHLAAFRRIHGLSDEQPTDVAIYAHGGLTDEERAAELAAFWVKGLYARAIFPIFVMWETGALATIGDILTDALHGAQRVAGFRTWLDERLEHVARQPGTALWDQMKDNAGKLCGLGGVDQHIAALRYVFESFGGASVLDPARTRLHLVGHSAGAIVHRHLSDYVLGRGWTIASCNFLASADRCEYFERSLLPHIGTRIRQYTQLHLSDAVELHDSLGPYSKSLLFLVSRAFERESEARILGMERYIPARLLALAGPSGPVALHASPSAASSAVHHGAFSTDALARDTVLAAIAAAASGGGRALGKRTVKRASRKPLAKRGPKAKPRSHKQRPA